MRSAQTCKEPGEETLQAEGKAGSRKELVMF